jgi:hypothetical protein
MTKTTTPTRHTTRCTSPPRHHTRACRPDRHPLPGETDGACPVCGLEVVYSRSADRFFHTDGTENRECWAHISRGDAPNFEGEVAAVASHLSLRRPRKVPGREYP